VAYATGKRAYGTCDRCARVVRYGALKTETVRGIARNVYVCRSCWDPDHPQNWVGSVPPVDSVGLEHPRPDQSEAEARSLWGWDPVGNAGNACITVLGTIGTRTR
jgi:hypothetical protein